MACGEGSATIACPPRAVLEFVLEVERYRLADRKIGRVHWMHRDGNHGQVKHNGRLLGLPFPAIVLAFTLTPWSRLDFRMVSAPWPLTGFEGSFTCKPTALGTRVTHRECFTLHPLIGLLDPLFGAWLTRDTPQEVGRIKQLLEREPCP
jgi:hypothetical protein